MTVGRALLGKILPERFGKGNDTRMLLGLAEEKARCEEQIALVRAEIRNAIRERDGLLARDAQLVVKESKSVDDTYARNRINTQVKDLNSRLRQLQASEEEFLTKSASLSKDISDLKKAIGTPPDSAAATPQAAVREYAESQQLEKLLFKKKELETKITEFKGQAASGLEREKELEKQLFATKKVSKVQRKGLDKAKEKLIDARAAKTQAIEGKKLMPKPKRAKLSAELEEAKKALAEAGSKARERGEAVESLLGELESLNNIIKMRKEKGGIVKKKKEYTAKVNSLNKAIQKIEDGIIQLKSEESIRRKLLLEFEEKRKALARLKQMKSLPIGELKPKAVEVPAKPKLVAVPPKKVEVAPGTSLLVKGPLARGTAFCNELMAAHMAKGETVAFLAFDPEKEGEPLPEKGRTLFKAHTELNELNITFSDMVRGNPNWVYVNVLYRITPIYSLDKIIQLTTIVLDKTKSAGSATLFVVDPATLTPQSLAMIENLFDRSVDVK